MLQETRMDKALKMVLAGKTVLVAVKKTGDANSTKYTFRSLNEILEKYIFLIQVPAVEDPEFKEKVAEMVQSVPAVNIVESPEKNRQISRTRSYIAKKEDIQAFCISVVNAARKKVFSQKQD